MHFAVCFFGLLRSLTYCIDSIRKHCLNPITSSGHTYDIFVHTYNFSGNYSNSRNGEKNPIHLNFSEWKLLNPYYIKIENQDEFDLQTNFTKFTTKGDPWHNTNPMLSLKNHVRALHSLHHLATYIESLQYQIKNKKNIKKYDGIIYFRPDVIYMNDIPIELLVESSSTLFVPDFHRSCNFKNDKGQYNDRFAMGDVTSAIAYGKRYNYAYNYSLSHLLLAENFVYDYLNLPHHKAAFNVIEIPFRFQRVRVQGNIHLRDLDMPTPLQQLTTKKSGTTPLRSIWYENDTNDPYNIYCSPNPRLNPQDVYKIYMDKNLNLDNYNEFISVYHASPWWFLLFHPFAFLLVFVILVFFCFFPQKIITSSKKNCAKTILANGSNIELVPRSD